MNAVSLPLFPTPKIQGAASGAFAAAATIAPLRGVRLDVRELPNPPYHARMYQPR